MWSPQQQPFTSDLQMWSPTPSNTTEDYYATTRSSFQNYYHESRNYHHEPVLICMLCGLPHSETLTAIVTPAPTVDISTIPAVSIEKRHQHKPRKQWMKRVKSSICGYLQTIINKLKTSRPIYPTHK